MSVYQISLYIVFLSEFMCHSSIITSIHALRFMASVKKVPVPALFHPEIVFVLKGIERNESHKVN